jgi:hypothetical protein
MAIKKIKLKSFTKDNCDTVKDPLREVLTALAEKTGVSWKVCDGGSYTNATYRFTVEVDLNIGGIAADVAAYVTNAQRYNLTERVGDIIQYKGNDYRILGWVGYGKHPIQVERVADGQKSGFCVELIPSYQVWKVKRDAELAERFKATQAARTAENAAAGK